MSIRTTVSGALIGLLLVSSPALAQQSRHVASQETMRAAVADKAQTEQQTRESVRRVLKNDQAAAVANRLGLNLVKAEAALATLSSAELARLAEPARQADAALAGGQNAIVISTTTLLLIIIIVILLVD